MPDRPPLADIDYVAATETAHTTIFSRLLDHGYQPDDAERIADLLDAVTVDAVWPILHAAAQPTGIEWVVQVGVNKATIEYATEEAQAREGYSYYRQVWGDLCTLAARRVTEWEPIEAGKQP